jgi:hypothetical protein
MLGVVGVLTGLLVLIHIGVAGSLPSPASYHEVNAYDVHRTAYVLLVLTAAAFTTFAVPFLAALPSLLSFKARLLAVGAAAALITGITVVTLGIALSIGALDAIKQLPRGPVYAANAAFEGAFWANLQSITNVLGDMLMGLGFLLLGWVAWDGETVRRWLAVVALAGGVGALLGIVADPLAGLAYLALVIWSFAVGVNLLRRPRAAAHT